MIEVLNEFVTGYSVELGGRASIPVSTKIMWHVKNIFKSRRSSDGLPYPSISLYHWKPEGGRFVNFGDELGRVLVDLILASKGASLLDEVDQPRLLLTVGSILHKATNDAVIWGTGLHGGSVIDDHCYKRLDVRAVRGPLTAKFLKKRGVDVPEVFGDPALLLPLVDGGRFKRTSKRKVCFVPNLHEMALVRNGGLLGGFPNIDVIDPRRAWNSVITDILDYEFVIASSLHGIVVAEAYGIPARYARVSETENILKYHDYYLGTGRVLEPAKSIAAALEMGGAEPFVFDTSLLLSSFPYDLWTIG